MSVAGVRCNFSYSSFFFPDKVVELVGGGPIINRAYPSSLLPDPVYFKLLGINNTTSDLLGKKLFGMNIPTN